MAVSEAFKKHMTGSLAKRKRDIAIDEFAADMKSRMDEKAAEGRTGWDDMTPGDKYTNASLMVLDAERFEVGIADHNDLVDVGVRAMMLHRSGVNQEPTDE